MVGDRWEERLNGPELDDRVMAHAEKTDLG